MIKRAVTLAVCLVSAPFSTSALAESWQELVRPQFGRNGLTLNQINGKLYVIGGNYVQRTTTNQIPYVEIYDPSKGSWSDQAHSCLWPSAQSDSEQPCEYRHHRSTVVEGRIYLVGGESSFWGVGWYPGSPSDKVLEYDPAQDIFTQKAPMRIARVGHTATSLNGKIYVAGGNTRDGLTKSVEVYDPTQDQWTLFTSDNELPKAVAYHAAVAVGGKLYVLSERGTFVFDPATSSWAEIMAMPTARRFVEAVTDGRSIWVLGGKELPAPAANRPPWPPVKTVEALIVKRRVLGATECARLLNKDCLQLETGLQRGWYRLPDLPTPLDAPSTARLDQNIHVVGKLFQTNAYKHYAIRIGDALAQAEYRSDIDLPAEIERERPVIREEDEDRVHKPSLEPKIDLDRPIPKDFPFPPTPRPNP